MVVAGLTSLIFVTLALVAGGLFGRSLDWTTWVLVSLAPTAYFVSDWALG